MKSAGLPSTSSVDPAVASHILLSPPIRPQQPSAMASRSRAFTALLRPVFCTAATPACAATVPTTGYASALATHATMLDARTHRGTHARSSGVYQPALAYDTPYHVSGLVDSTQRRTHGTTSSGR